MEVARRKQGRGLAEAKGVKEARKETQQATLRQIEDVLDSLNTSTNAITTKGSSYGANVKETLAKMKTFAKPSSQIDSLVTMINEVIDGIEP